MNIELREASIASVAELAGISIAFTVDRTYDVLPAESGAGFVLAERAIDAPYVKDYDTLPGQGPSQWARRFDVSRWGFIRAETNGRLIGGAVIAIGPVDVAPIERRQDLAVLWDIRVAPEVRRQGVGSALFHAVEAWAVARNCRQLEIETQNINVAACRFYARHGCVLGAVHRGAYPELPGELQLLWFKDLSPRETPTSEP